MNTPIPFGRPQNFSFGSNVISSSPTQSISSHHNQSNWESVAGHSDESLHHTRGDSFASESSSFGHGRPNVSVSAGKPSSLGHTTTASIGGASVSQPVRKGSFASLKNAIKSATGKNQNYEAPPPMPTLDQSSYPALRNPFHRSGSSKGAVATLARPAPSPTPAASRRRPSAASPSPTLYITSRSPPSQVQTPSIHARGGSNMSNPFTRRPSRGNLGGGHSPNSSITQSENEHLPPSGFHTGAGSGSSGGPISRGSNPSSAFHQPTRSVVSEVIPEVEPSTPAEYALNVVLTGFVTAAEKRIEAILDDRLVSHTY